MDRWKAEKGRGREKRKIRRKKSRRERVRRKQMQLREKVGKSRFTVFFQWFVAPEGRKVGSLKRRVRSQLARWEMKNCTPLWREAHLCKSKCTKHTRPGPLLAVEISKKCTPLSREASKSKCTKHTRSGPHLAVAMSKKCTPLWREAHFKVKMYKTHHSRTTFGSWDVEKVDAVVARSTFRSEHEQNTTCSRHFWKFRSRKSARRGGAKHISKWTWTKHYMFAPLLEVQISKKCTPLWRKAHLEVKLLKTRGVRTTFGGSDVALLHYTTLHYTTLHSSTLHYTTSHYTTLHYITLYYTIFHYTSLPYTTLHSITL